MKDLLPLVNRPSRYVGGEINAVRKDHNSVDLKVVLAYPDVYDVGMSHMGIHILYHLLNDRPDYACERVYCPWPDMEAVMRERGRLLASLETGTEVRRFDIFGITVPHELCYSNIVNLLELAGIPKLARERGRDEPVVLGGGSSVFNPEPIADCYDAILIGDAEEAILDIGRAVLAWRGSGAPREDLWHALAGITGVYVPVFFEPHYDADGRYAGCTSLKSGYEVVRKRFLMDLNKAYYPRTAIIPYTETVHDRLNVELFRGCTFGCRFCQAGYTYRPLRERSPEQVLEILEESLRNTGHSETSLLSLSTGDYSCLTPLVTTIMAKHRDRNLSLSLPSMRVTTLTPPIIDAIATTRRTGFTIAPEAGTRRLREVINKDIHDEDIYKTVDDVFARGWTGIKLYFMIGQPTETWEDVEGIAKMAHSIVEIGRRHRGRKTCTVSVSNFVPKSHTPFQWERQLNVEEVREKQTWLRRALSHPRITFRYHPARLSVLEGLFSRGDRRMCQAVLRAHALGARFDSWEEHYREDVWTQAIAEAGVDPERTLAEWDQDAPLPWDHIDCGVRRDWLARERRRARNTGTKTIPDCRHGKCTICGTRDECDHTGRMAEVDYDPADHPPAPPRPRDQQPEQRLRVRYAKLGDKRFLGHLELAQTFHRALARTALPVRFSQGFSPKPKLAFGPPLPVGVESHWEFMDVELVLPVEPQDFVDRLNEALPDGLIVEEARPIAQRAPSIFLAVGETAYLVEDLPLERERIAGTCEAFKAQASFPIHRMRKGEEDLLDVAPLVGELRAEGDHGLVLTLRHRAAGLVKPAELVEAVFGLDHDTALGLRVLKTGARMRTPEEIETLQEEAKAHTEAGIRSAKRRGNPRTGGRRRQPVTAAPYRHDAAGFPVKANDV